MKTHIIRLKEGDVYINQYLEGLVRYDKTRAKWKCDFHYNGDIKVSLGYYEDQVNAGYVWYNVAKEFRGVMGDNRKLFKLELPEEDENREEKIKEGIEKVNKKTI